MDITGRLVKLRAFRPEDARPIAEALADPEIVSNLANWSWGPYGLNDAQEFISRREPGQLAWAIECLADGTLVGATGFQHVDPRNRHCEWGIWIGPKSRWGHGYGSEACQLAVRFAFHQLGMEKVWLFVYEGNDRGRRAYEKAGFRVEGTLERHVFKDGRFINVYLMAVFRDHHLYAAG